MLSSFTMPSVPKMFFCSALALLVAQILGLIGWRCTRLGRAGVAGSIPKSGMYVVCVLLAMSLISIVALN